MKDDVVKPLSTLLQELRAAKGCSLREVEKATGISNAYISQIERGDAQKPSPDKLHAIATFYEVPYMELMRAAGYVEKSSAAGSQRRDLNAAEMALMSANLTAEEVDAVVDYIKFLRFQKK